ncbi:MAG: GspE/PulE family protein [Planctomycetota bacterium]
MIRLKSKSSPRAPGRTTKQIGTLLVERGDITEAQLREALNQQNEAGHRRLLGEILTELNYVTPEQVLEVMAEIYGVPFARVSPKVADPRVVEVLPREFLETQCVLPLFLVRNRLTVAVSEPANLYLIEEVERLCGHEVQIVASTAADILSTLRQYLPDANVFVIDDIYEDLDDNEFAVVDQQLPELKNLEEVAGHSPVVKLVNSVVYSAVQDGASDIHVEPDSGRLRIRYRVDGRLFTRLSPPQAMHPAIVSRIKIMSGLDISERRVPQDGDIHVMLDGRPVDLRVSTMPGKCGEKVVIRIIDSSSIVVGLEKLGFSPKMLTDWRKAVNQPNGVVLVTGPTGSGKSTTLYSVLAELNSEEMNISTVEDPVEAGLLGINQFQVNEKAGFTFAGALRALLRQDPDIVMVGEIRDTETARIATQAALTGHLVLSTLHTNDAVSAVTRMMNLGIEPYLVAAILRGALSQRLVRKICPHCKEAYEPDPVLRQGVEETVGCVEQLYRGRGCNKCRGTGFSGRLGIFELFIPDDDVCEAIGDGVNLHDLRDLLAKQNYITLRMDGMQKARDGMTTIEEVLYVAAI